MTSSIEWVAGVISVLGELKVPHKGKPRIQMLLSSTKHPEAVEIVANFFKQPVLLLNGRPTMRLTGADLDKAMDKLWAHLTEDRRQEYNDLVTIQQSKMNAYGVEKKQKALDKAFWEGKQDPTPEQRRKRREAEYHNQDAAVQVVDEAIDMVDETEVSLAAVRRQFEKERERAEMPWLYYDEEKK